jgi:hypothetical protein
VITEGTYGVTTFTDSKAANGRIDMLNSISLCGFTEKKEKKR